MTAIPRGLWVWDGFSGGDGDEFFPIIHQQNSGKKFDLAQ
jgi:hypothetical protein